MTTPQALPVKRWPLALILLVVLGVLALTSLPALIRLLSDWYWFSAVGFQSVFVKTLGTKLLLGFGTGLLAFGFFYANLRFSQRGVVPDPLVVNINAKTPKVDVTRLLRLLALPVSGFLAFIVGVSASSQWLVLLQYLNRTAFGVSDPAFGKDIGYYFFTLPGVAAVTAFVLSLTVLTLLMVSPLYLVRGDIVIRGRRITIEPSAERHLGALLAVLFLATAVSLFWVRLPSLLFSGSGPIHGAAYADLTARVPFIYASAVVSIIGAGLIAWGLKSHRLPRFLAVAVVLYLVTGVVGGLYPAAIQRFVVDPNELVKETPFIERHIEATRAAWNLDEVEIRTMSGEASLTLDDIRANSGTIRNIRLWDRGPLLQTFGQLQEIRTYYDFVSVDDDRYMIDGELRQVLLSPRELNSASLPSRTFINEHLTYTHGMGLTLSPVNQVTLEGLPTLFIKDLPPASSVSIGVTRPEIYYGELSNDYVFVNTRQAEFDYPSGDSSATTVYAGVGGVRVNSIFRKLLLAARLGSANVFLNKDIHNGSRVLYHRNIRERAEKALPFLRWDADPYMVVTDEGRLKWFLDAYTTGNRYPYSQPYRDGPNYLRNSVKVLIDAYDGTIDAYIAEPDDPIIQTYAKIFPNLLQPLEDMPDDLRAHIRYPDDLFRAQTELYATFHMDDPTVFYGREDQWQIPSASGTRGEGSRDPYMRHIVMKLPEEASEEFILMTPFTPRGKENLTAWLVARMDGEHYGQLVVYRFPRQSLVFGPTQIVNRIDQDTDVSRQITLWDQAGSDVIRGNLLVIPIEEALLFVQALYLRAEGGRIPELKRVIVAFENRVVMEETLERGLSRLFGGTVLAETGRVLPQLPVTTAGAAATAATVSPAMADLLRQAEDHYQRALDAQRNGDWATYGDEIEQVGSVLRRLRGLLNR
ncbi:MAG: UPF0182 family protein [Gemmatimonadetes bacterium]|nr:UPF0182 family protein [Gemmatimonadota bacterium]